MPRLHQIGECDYYLNNHAVPPDHWTRPMVWRWRRELAAKEIFTLNKTQLLKLRKLLCAADDARTEQLKLEKMLRRYLLSSYKASALSGSRSSLSSA